MVQQRRLSVNCEIEKAVHSHRVIRGKEQILIFTNLFAGLVTITFTLLEESTFYFIQRKVHNKHQLRCLAAQ